MAINIPIISSLNTKGFDAAKKEFASLQGFGAKSGFLLQKAMVPAAGAVSALAGGLVLAAKAAIEDEQSQRLLETQLRATLGPNQALADSMADFVDQTQLATGVADTELRPALANLIRFTGDATKAQDLLTLSIDASTATGKDLSAVSTAIGKAYDGNFTALKKLGVPLDDNIIKTKDFEAAQRALNAQFGGAAAANANTFAGRIQILRTRFDEMVESIGYKVLPALGDLLDYVDRLIKIMDERGLGGVIRELGGKLRRFVDPFQALEDAILRNVEQTDGLIDRFKQTGVNIVNLGSGFLNFGGKILGLNFNLGKLKTELDKTNDGLALAYANTRAWSETILQLDADQKRANYQKAVDIEQQRLANLEISKSTASTDKAAKAAKRAAAETAKHAEAVRTLKESYDNAVQTVKDKFAPALMRANEQLTKATDNYNAFYNATADVVRGIFNVGDAFTTAKDNQEAFNKALTERSDAYTKLSKLTVGTEAYAAALEEVAQAEEKVTQAEKPKRTFFDVLDDQAKKAGELATGIEKLIAAGLDDPELLKSILASGADVGLEIIKGLLAGGKASIDRLLGISTTINAAADRIAKLTADKWYKSGIDQAQAIVDGVNSVIANTEFLLRFALDPQSVTEIGQQLDASLGTVFGGGAAPAPTTNPFGPILGSINASPNMDGSRVSTSNVTINVQGGDPNAVVSALRAYMRTNGSVPIRVSNAY
jgi:hypothetical protein